MAVTYRDRVVKLIRNLSKSEHYDKALEALRDLIDEVVLTPISGAGKRPRPQVTLHRALAGILSLCLGFDKALSKNAKTAAGATVLQSAEFLVAGVCNTRCLPPSPLTCRVTFRSLKTILLKFTYE